MFKHSADLKPISPTVNMPIRPSGLVVPPARMPMEPHLFTQLHEAIEKTIGLPMQTLIEGLARQIRNIPVPGFPAAAFRPAPKGDPQGFIEYARAQARSASALFGRQRLVPPTKEHIVCARAYREMQEGDQDAVLFFTTNVLRLPKRYMPSVAAALWDSNWRCADSPYAYVRDAARKIYADHYADHYEESDSLFYADRRTATQHTIEIISLDTPTITGDPLGTLIPDPHDPLRIVMDIDDVAYFCRTAQLSPDQLKYIQANDVEGYTGAALRAYLGWDQRKIEAVRRSIDRIRSKLKRRQL
jgi:hypothetical protein